jgi:hypothetical protein
MGCRLKRWSRIILAGIVLLLGASLLSRPVQSERASAPLLPGAQVDQQVLSILQRACQDCHSGTTHYPWYSYIAPVSWWLQGHVANGRKHLDLSTWNTYPLPRRERLLSDIANQVKDGEMPLRSYTLIHRDARLSESDVNAIFRWTQTERARLIAESSRADR